MSEECVDVWNNAPFHDKARALDTHSPQCLCEMHSLHSAGGAAIADDEIIARIVTSPDAYSLENDDLIAGKLRSVFSSGLSVVRQGASDDEIKSTVNELTQAGAEPTKLVGAAIMPAGVIRRFQGQTRWFCVYHTEAGSKTHHGDIAATATHGATPSAVKKIQSDRRQELQDLFKSSLVFVDNVDDLIAKFREFK